jgi:hypothetical protein
MGMYTQLNINVTLDNNHRVIGVLNKLINQNDDEELNIDDPHPFFKCLRFRYVFHSCSYYFDSKPYANLTFDTINKLYYFSTVFDLKNYDSEIEEFLNWLCPYIETNGYLGTFWYEEWEYPWMIFKEDGKIVFKNATEIINVK